MVSADVGGVPVGVASVEASVSLGEVGGGVDAVVEVDVGGAVGDGDAPVSTGWEAWGVATASSRARAWARRLWSVAESVGTVGSACAEESETATRLSVTTGLGVTQEHSPQARRQAVGRWRWRHMGSM